MKVKSFDKAGFDAKVKQIKANPNLAKEFYEMSLGDLLAEVDEDENNRLLEPVPETGWGINDTQSQNI